MEAQTFTRSVYLPAGTRWEDAASGKMFDGGQNVIVDAPLDIIPVFVREGKEYKIY